MSRTLTCSTLAAVLAAVSPHVAGQETAETIHLDFEDGELESWLHIKLADRATRFSVTNENDESVLRADSEHAAAALWYGLDLSPRADHVVSWRWKVAGALNGNARERGKKGDDYAARFFVIFDEQPFSSKARAICYVWAASEPVGAVYPNPYFSTVATMVLQSGEANAGKWVVEERALVDDYVRAFGQAPRSITAVAVMVDTDNTERRATAWFDKISVGPRSADPPGSGAGQHPGRREDGRAGGLPSSACMFWMNGQSSFRRSGSPTLWVAFARCARRSASFAF